MVEQSINSTISAYRYLLESNAKNAPKVETSKYALVRKHPDGAGDVECINCHWISIIYGEKKQKLAKHEFRCRSCGALLNEYQEGGAE